MSQVARKGPLPSGWTYAVKPEFDPRVRKGDSWGSTGEPGKGLLLQPVVDGKQSEPPSQPGRYVSLFQAIDAEGTVLATDYVHPRCLESVRWLWSYATPPSSLPPPPIGPGPLRKTECESVGWPTCGICGQPLDREGYAKARRRLSLREMLLGVLLGAAGGGVLAVCLYAAAHGWTR